MEDWPPLAPQGGDRNKKNHQRYLRNKLEIDSLVILCASLCSGCSISAFVGNNSISPDRPTIAAVRLE